MKKFTVFFGQKPRKKQEQRVVEAYLRKICAPPDFDAGTTWYVAPKSGGPISVENALNHLKTPRHQSFKNHLTSSAHPSMVIHDNDDSLGFWVDLISGEGSPEPSAYTHLTAPDSLMVKKWAAQIGHEHNQQSVLVFEHDQNGGHLKHSIKLPASLDIKKELVPLLQEQGIQGFSYLPERHSLAVVDFGDVTDKIRNLVSSLKAAGHDPQHTEEPGTIDFINQDEYDTYLGNNVNQSVVPAKP